MPVSDSSPIPEIAEAAVKLAVAEAESLTLQVMEEEARILRNEVERLKADAASALPSASPTPATRTQSQAASATRQARRSGTRGSTRGTTSVRQAVSQVLAGKSGGMHTKDVTAAVMETDGVSLQGQTPEATVASFLASEHKKGRTGLVRRTKPGHYALRSARSR